MVEGDNGDQKPLRVFLAYAREDRQHVEALYGWLKGLGLDPWMDCKNIVAGEEWERSIWRAIRAADFVLACLSSRSVRKRGFLQREIRRALTLWEEKLDGDIFFIPVRLEQCDLPDRLRPFQCVDLFETGGRQRLLDAIHAGSQRRGLKYVLKTGEPPRAEVRAKTITEMRSEFLSYEIHVEYPEIVGAQSSWAMEANSRLSEFAVKLVHDFREQSDGVQDVLQHNGDLAAFLRDFPGGDSLAVSYRVHLLTQHLLSVEFSVTEYGAGAAHPNTRTVPHNYHLSPTYELKLDDLLRDEGLLRISYYCVQELARPPRRTQSPTRGEAGGIDRHERMDRYRSGLAPLKDNFRKFFVTETALLFVFDPYQVGSYAEGRIQVAMPYTELRDLLQPLGPLWPLVGN